MNTKNKKIFFYIIVFIIFLISIFILNRGHGESIDLYLEKYRYKPRNKYNKRVVVSLNANIDEIDKIRNVILSILKQNVRVDEISLNIYDPKLEFNIPDEFNKVIIVYRTGKDYFKYMNIIPTLLREGENDTIIIVIKNINPIMDNNSIERIIDQNLKDDCIIELDNLCLVKPEYISENIVDDFKKDENFYKKRVLQI